MVKKRHVPDARDIIWIDFEPVRGHEQERTRPAVVLTQKKYNERTGMALVCPITSQKKNYPFEVDLGTTKTTGVILSDQVRSIDLHTRQIRKAGDRIHKDTLDEVHTKLTALLNINN